MPIIFEIFVPIIFSLALDKSGVFFITAEPYWNDNQKAALKVTPYHQNYICYLNDTYITFNLYKPHLAMCKERWGLC